LTFRQDGSTNVLEALRYIRTKEKIKMGQVVAGFTMSLDGFIAGPGDDVQHLFQWYGSGDTAFPVPGTDMEFKIARASADLLREEWATLGAIVTGRRDFDVSDAWGGRALLDLPIFVVTHSVPQAWAGPDSPFTFVTAGVERAIDLARQAAGDKHVGVGGSQITQQALTAGLLDAIYIDLAPVLLGDGIRLFDHLGGAPIDLEYTKVVATPGVTHLRFRVVK
jgi:dihydrofolate reductase